MSAILSVSFLLDEILGFLPILDLVQSQLVCKLFRDFVQTPSTWRRYFDHRNIEYLESHVETLKAAFIHSRKVLICDVLRDFVNHISLPQTWNRTKIQSTWFTENLDDLFIGYPLEIENKILNIDYVKRDVLILLKCTGEPCEEFGYCGGIYNLKQYEEFVKSLNLPPRLGFQVNWEFKVWITQKKHADSEPTLEMKHFPLNALWRCIDDAFYDHKTKYLKPSKSFRQILINVMFMTLDTDFDDTIIGPDIEYIVQNNIESF